MNSWISVLTQWLLRSQLALVFPDALLKSFVVLAVAGGLCQCWRRAAASIQHLVWLLAVAGLLCLPALSGLLPAWPTPLWTVQARASSGNEITLKLELVPGAAKAGAPRQTVSPSLAAGDLPARPSQRLEPPAITTRFGANWFASILALWLLGATLVLSSLAVARWRLRVLGRWAHPPADSDWRLLLDQTCQESGVRRRVTLLQSAGGVMPVTWGWLRPVILLPTQADAWSPERRRVVLLHELAHVKRWDCFTQLLARLACAVYWFNPLVWLAARRMCIERERACDDRVLACGCRASDYATHLVDIARTFPRVPEVAAIAMARPSRLEGRIAAIVDGSRARGGPPGLLIGLCCLAVLGFVAAVAAQKPATDPQATASEAPPWFDGRLRAFFRAKAEQAHHLAEQGKKPLAPEVWPYFEAGIRGDWPFATNLWLTMRQRATQYESPQADERICATAVWSTILETDLAWEQFANWKEKYVLAYGNDIIRSIPAGSIYFGGTDPGRGVITAMSESHAQGKPFFTLTQNALADGVYLEYLRAMYGTVINTPSAEDSQKSFDEYLADVQRRLAENKLKPGEAVGTNEGRIQVTGQVAVMSINGLLAKIIFDRNPEREFYIEESFPLDWMYPHLLPNGLIMKINREPLPSLSAAVVRQDHEYWSRYCGPMLGDWLNDDTPVAEVAAFVERVYLRHDLTGFTGDRQFIEHAWAQKAFSKLRSSLGGLYSWRMSEAKAPEDKQRMRAEADFAFRQAWALCPVGPEALFRYVNLLLGLNRTEDALILAQTTLKLDPQNAQVKDLADRLKSFKPTK